MHDIEFPTPELIAFAEQRRGRVHVYDALDPAKTALLVVDMQGGFVAEGAPAEVPAARGIVPNINRLAAAVRGHGAPVVWIKMTLAPDGPDAFPGYENFATPERAAALFAALADGAELHDVYAPLEVLDGDMIVHKNRYSVFIEGASTLEAQLRARGIDTVIITGTLTNVCCESSARDAMMRNFKVVMASDANAAPTDDAHFRGLATVFTNFGDVRPTDEVIALLDAGAAATSRAAE